jgi:hypothetical protein
MTYTERIRFATRVAVLTVGLWGVAPLTSHAETVSDSPVKWPHRSGTLTDEEMQMARIAWTYFENNYQEKTGLVNAVDGYPSTTMWDTASYLAALTAAERLGLIDKTTFDQRLGQILKTLNELDFFRKELPNKVYHTQTAAKVNYGNKPGEIGYSALDLGRLLIWLKIIKERYPEHEGQIDRFVLRWDFSNVVDDCGTLYGAMLTSDKSTQYVQEGRLGYEEYAAKGFGLWGFSTCLASKTDPYAMIPIYGVDVPYDIRDPRKLTQHNYVVSESYVLDGVELGWDKPSDRGQNLRRHSDKLMENFAQRVYQAQENRYKATGILTARSEHQLDRAPYFVYDTVYSDGYAWNTITDNGKYVPEFAAISLKAALGMWALWKSPYTDLLGDTIWSQYVTDKGYYEGIYENGSGAIKTFTANNNGIMLESLLFKSEGKLLQFNQHEPQYKKTAPSLWDRTLTDPFEVSNKRLRRPFVMTDPKTFKGSAPTTRVRPIFTLSSSSNKSCPQLSPDLSNRATSVENCPTCKPCAVCQDDTPVTLPAWSSSP